MRRNNVSSSTPLLRRDRQKASLLLKTLRLSLEPAISVFTPTGMANWLIIAPQLQSVDVAKMAASWTTGRRWVNILGVQWRRSEGFSAQGSSFPADKRDERTILREMGEARRRCNLKPYWLTLPRPLNTGLRFRRSCLQSTAILAVCKLQWLSFGVSNSSFEGQSLDRLQPQKPTWRTC